MAEAKDTFVTLRKACHKAPVLAFADLDKPFPLATDASKLGLGGVYPKNRLRVNTIQQHMQADL